MTQGHHRQAMEGGTERFSNTNERTVYLEMMYWADKRGVIRRTQQDMAEDTLMHRVTVSNAIRALTDKGLIRKVRHGRYAIPNAHYEPSSANGTSVVQSAMLRLSRDGGRTVVIDPEADQDGTARDTMLEAQREGLAKAAGYAADGALVWHIVEP